MAKERIFPFRSGQLIPNSPYRVLKILGSGGMAAVYRAEDISLRKTVVIKMLHTELAGSAAAELMRAEARALAAMYQHSNAFTCVLRTDDASIFTETAGRGKEVRLPYYVMELIDGPTLRAVLVHKARAGEPLPIGTTLGVARDVATALSHAHGESIVHRDIKPENIMFHCKKNEAPAIRVIDFGVIGRMGEDINTTDHGFKGTLLYAAPEQLAERPVSGATDFYSLGVVMFEMLAGRPPYAGAPHDIAQGHLYQQPPRVTAFRPETPPRLSAIVDALLTKDPFKRVEMFRRRASLEGQHGLVLAQALEDIRRDLQSSGKDTVALGDIVGDVRVRGRGDNTTDADPSQRGRVRRRVAADDGAPDSATSTAPGVDDLMAGLGRNDRHRDNSEVIVGKRRSKQPPLRAAPPPTVRDDRTDPMAAPPSGMHRGVGAAKTDVDPVFVHADAGGYSLTKTQPLPIPTFTAAQLANPAAHESSLPITPSPVVVIAAVESAHEPPPLLNSTAEIMNAVWSEPDNIWQDSDADAEEDPRKPTPTPPMGSPISEPNVDDVKSDSPLTTPVERGVVPPSRTRGVSRGIYVAFAGLSVAAAVLVGLAIEVERRAMPLVHANVALGVVATWSIPTIEPAAPEIASPTTSTSPRVPLPSASSASRLGAARGGPTMPSAASSVPGQPDDFKPGGPEHPDDFKQDFPR